MHVLQITSLMVLQHPLQQPLSTTFRVCVQLQLGFKKNIKYRGHLTFTLITQQKARQIAAQSLW